MLGLLTGGVGAIITNLAKSGIDYFHTKQKMEQDASDKAHELKMLNKQGQINQNIQNSKAEAQILASQTEAYAEIFASKEDTIQKMMNSDIFIVRLLSGLIRPCTTIYYTGLFSFTLYMTYTYATIEKLPIEKLVQLAPIVVFLELVSMVTSFWFIDRKFSKPRK